MKTQIGLGVLSIPVAFDSLGIVPGVICLCAIAAITTWSDYIIGVFKLRHREVYGIDDVGELLLGPTGRILLGGAFVLCELNPKKKNNTRSHKSQLLTHDRVGFRRRLGNARTLYRSQCCLRPRRLHGGLCCHCCYYSMHTR